MKEVFFIASSRDLAGKKPKVLRREGLLPAVIYGGHIQPTPITLNLREADHILPHVTTSQLVVIDLNGEKHTTLVRERQRNPLTGSLIHVDFQAVSMTEKLRAMVRLVIRGESPFIKAGLGVLVTGVEQIEVQSLPGDLPEEIFVDVSTLENIGDSIHVSNLSLSADVEILTNQDEMVVLITAPEVEYAEEEEVAVLGTEPEVIERGKKEEEEA